MKYKWEIVKDKKGKEDLSYNKTLTKQISIIKIKVFRSTYYIE